jgi:DNA polymerase
MSRQQQYDLLVSKRKKCSLCVLTAHPEEGLTSPATIKDGAFDSDQIGPWSRWQGNLNAEIMVVGQDWGGVKYFNDCQGDDQLSNNPTNVNLHKLLLNQIGKDIKKSDVNDDGIIFLTNIILCLKQGNLQDPIKKEWLSNCSKHFFKPLVDVVRPKIIIALGSNVSHTILDLYEVAYSKSVSLSQLMESSPFNLTESTDLFPVYHCGAGGVNRNRSLEMQQDDWAKIASWYNSH